MKKVILGIVFAFAAVIIIHGIFWDDSEGNNGGYSLGDSWSGVSDVDNEFRNKLNDNESLYPVYRSLNESERDTYVRLCTAIMNHDESVNIGVYDSDNNREKVIEWIDHYFHSYWSR